MKCGARVSSPRCDPAARDGETRPARRCGSLHSTSAFARGSIEPCCIVSASKVPAVFVSVVNKGGDWFIVIVVVFCK